jgi:branched-subunit amino acid ABC-type transport system permease component
MIFQEAVMLIYTGDYRTVSALIEGYFIVTGVKVFYQQVLTFVVVLLVLAVLWFLLMKTRLGLAIRSTAEDREVANLMGMNESRLAMITMGISVALAGFTGAVLAPLTVLSPFMWMEPLIIMMAVVVLGGLGQHQGKFRRGLYPGVHRSPGGLYDPQRRFPERIRRFDHHDPGPAASARRSLWRLFRGREVGRFARLASGPFCEAVSSLRFVQHRM